MPHLSPMVWFLAPLIMLATIYTMVIIIFFSTPQS